MKGCEYLDGKIHGTNSGPQCQIQRYDPPVYKEENLEERVSLPQYSWNTSDMTPYRPQKQDIRMRSGLWWWLEKELEGNPELKRKLRGLAKVIQEQTGGFKTDIYEFSQSDNKLWAAGAYTNNINSGGFICHSEDNGKSWQRQWNSKHGRPDPAYGIYFSDSSEGWALTLKGILHTANGGSSWRRALECDGHSISNLFILDKENLIVTEGRPYHFGIYVYSSNNRGLSWDKLKITSSLERGLDKLVISFGKGVVHYGGIYSKEE